MVLDLLHGVIPVPDVIFDEDPGRDLVDIIELAVEHLLHVATFPGVLLQPFLKLFPRLIFQFELLPRGFVCRLVRILGPVDVVLNGSQVLAAIIAGGTLLMRWRNELILVMYGRLATVEEADPEAIA